MKAFEIAALFFAKAMTGVETAERGRPGRLTSAYARKRYDRQDDGQFLRKERRDSMKIADSTVTMASNRSYNQIGAKGGSYAGQLLGGSVSGSGSQGTKSWMDTFESKTGEDSGFGFYTKSGRGIGKASFGSDADEETVSVRDQLLEILLQRMMPLLQAGYGSFGQGGMSVMQSAMSYYEEESTSFSAKGQATTEEGRVIDFSVDIRMSRTYMEYTQIGARMPSLAAGLMDPLMINVSSAVTSVSDQRFRFDLNADGTEEWVNMPGKGTGFLALDLNGDGKVNDGSELFGARSGDGFEDLRKYDIDGNGWIDENDGIFEKLRVWYKNGDGKEELVDLKTADVGAIYLGEQSTDFSLNNAAGRLNGMIRSTGFFLKESGGVGTVQHVDLAVSDRETDEEEAAGGFTLTLNLGSGSRSVQQTESRNGRRDTAAQRRRERMERAEEQRKEEKERIERVAEHRKEEKERIGELAERRREYQERIDKLFEERKEKKEEEEEYLDRRRMLNERVLAAYA